MSMVAGLTLPDGVVLVADGMVATFTQGKGEPTALNPDVNKLEQVGPSIFAARFGVESVSGEIIERLRDGVYLSPGQVRDRLQEVTAEVWAPDGSVPLERLGDAAGVGVLVGGLVGGVPFLSAILRHPTEDPKDIHWEDAWAMWVCGLEPEADERFYSTVGKAANGSFNRFGWPAFQGPMNDVVLTVLGSVVKVMQDAAENEPYSGGTFRIALVRKGYEPLEKCVTTTPPPQPGGTNVLCDPGVAWGHASDVTKIDGGYINLGVLTGRTIRTAETGASAIMASSGGYVHGLYIQNASNQLLTLLRNSKLPLCAAGAQKVWLDGATSPAELHFDNSGKIHAATDLTIETAGDVGDNMIIDAYQIALSGSTFIAGAAVTLKGTLGFDVLQVAGKNAEDEYISVKRQDGTQRYLRLYS